MKIRKEVVPFVAASVLFALIVGGIFWLAGLINVWSASITGATGIVLVMYMAWFFRDPERTAPADPSLIVAGADGVVAAIKEMPEDTVIKGESVRISIFLSLFNVHVNRAPIEGKVELLDYYRGKRHFTFMECASDENQQSAIGIHGEKVNCLVNQIVGPVCRRVVYWLTLKQELKKGDKIGMMKFGSRMDIYLPKSAVTITAKIGDKTVAGETVIATIN